MIKIGKMTLGSLATNCYFVYRDDAKRALVFDPADYGAYIREKLAEHGNEVASIFLTHGHFDHIWGVDELRRLTGVKVHALEAEKELLGNMDMNVSEMFGRPCAVEADVYLRDGEKITAADITFEVIATPGHTSGSCCFYFEEEGFLISGDTLLAGSTGRTDFPTGSQAELVRSIQERLFTLPDDVRVYPGHGSATTIGYEKENNPLV